MPNLAGLLLFGTKMALRRLRPMDRVDYIRVPGREWIDNPDERFTSVDMRGSLLSLVSRAVNTIIDDLPKGFQLDEDEVQAKTISIPNQALRETVVNALMHRSYRTQQPIQIIRYSNRIEFINPSISLKPDSQLGEPGSKPRNGVLAAVFHETNLAETKGSGIGSIRKYLSSACIMPPTFESQRDRDTFTARLLLHHLLPDSDLRWLAGFNRPVLNDDQKKALVFVREAGAIDRLSYCQLNGCEKAKAAADIKALRDEGWLELKSKVGNSYYKPSAQLLVTYGFIKKIVDEQHRTDDSASLMSEDIDEGEPSQEGTVTSEIQAILESIWRRVSDPERLSEAILRVTKIKPFSVEELADVLKRSPEHLYKRYIRPLYQEGRLRMLYPEMPNHPEQAYLYTGRAATI